MRAISGYAMQRFAVAVAAAAAILLDTSAVEAGRLAPSQDHRCDYEFSGPVTDGDFEQFKPLSGGPSDWPVVCLNSPGGQLTGAARIFEHIWQQNVATAVLPGHECLSACAIMFLGGSFSTGSDTTYHFDRKLWAGGRLGLHSPSLRLPQSGSYSPGEVEQAFEGALRAARLIYEINQTVDRGNRAMSNYLYYQILSTPPSQMKFIDTVADAVLSDIQIISDENWQYALDPATLSDDQIGFVCQNFLARNTPRQSFLKTSADSAEHYRIFLETPVGPMNPRVQRAIHDGKQRFLAGPYFAATKFFDYHCLISYAEGIELDPDAAPENRETRVGSFSVSLLEDNDPEISDLPTDVWYDDVREVPLYFRFDPETAIAEIASATGKAVASASAARTYRFIRNRDIEGLDLDRRFNVTQQQCVDFCTSLGACDTVVYNRWNSACFAKSHDGRTPMTFSAPSDIMTLKANTIRDAAPVSPAGFARRGGRVFEGDSFISFGNMDAERCEAACAQETRCAAYHSIGGICELFEVTRTHVRSEAEAVIGYRTPN